MTTIDEPDQPGDDTPLGEARKWLYDRVEELADTACPCCAAPHQVYHRMIDATVAGYLVEAYRIDDQFRAWRHGVAPRPPEEHIDGEGWTHWPSVIGAKGGGYTRLPLWGLLERASHHQNPDLPRVGHYRFTEQGRRFVRGQLTVPRCARVLGRAERFMGWCDGRHRDQTVSIADALGQPFSFDELLGRGSVDPTTRGDEKAGA